MTTAGSVDSSPSGSNVPEASLPGSSSLSTYPTILPSKEKGAAPAASGAGTSHSRSQYPTRIAAAITALVFLPKLMNSTAETAHAIPILARTLA